MIDREDELKKLKEFEAAGKIEKLPEGPKPVDINDLIGSIIKPFPDREVWKEISPGGFQKRRLLRKRYL